MRMKTILGCAQATTVLLAGCALSPQQVELLPQVAPAVASNVGKNLPVTVVGNDKRASAVIGSRGSIYAETSLIRASNKVAGELAALVRNNRSEERRVGKECVRT